MAVHAASGYASVSISEDTQSAWCRPESGTYCGAAEQVKIRPIN